MMHPVIHSFGRALMSMLHVRMLLLTIAPFFLSVLIWGVVLYFSLQPMIDWLHAYFVAHDLFRSAAGWLGAWGSGVAANVVVPLIAMWMFLPLMILTALIFIGTLAMPVIVKHVATRLHPQLERRRGGHLLGSLWRSLSSFIVFALLWIVSLPLSVIPPLGFLITPLLWGWLTYRVMVYDALAEHADGEEFRTLQRRHRWPLLLIGTITGALGAAPTLLWLGGILAVVLFPFFAALSIWLYVLVFVFTGLWFEHYCLRALAQMREQTAVIIVDGTDRVLKDIN